MQRDAERVPPLTAAQPIRGLDELAEADATVAPLARLQAIALRAAGREPWLLQLSLRPTRDRRAPVLHEATVVVDPGRLRVLLDNLTVWLGAPNLSLASGVQGLGTAVDDVLGVVEAAIVLDDGQLSSAAAALRADRATFVVLAQLAALPTLLACAEQVGRPSEASCTAGFCPVCAAWPVLSELRGVDRERWLRCGRCATAWRFPHARCVYCGEVDHRRLGYLAPERERESRRVEVCEQCGGYLKAFASFGPLSPAELLLRDLASVELDLAALDDGYARPPGLGFSLALRLAAASSEVGRAGAGA